MAHAQWYNFTTFSTYIDPYIGNGTLSYRCFCSADSGNYEFYKYLSPTSGIKHIEQATTDGGANWVTISNYNIQGGWVNYIGCYNDKQHHILYRFNLISIHGVLNNTA